MTKTSIKNLIILVLLSLSIYSILCNLNTQYRFDKKMEEFKSDNKQMLNESNKISQSLRIDIEELRLELEFIKRYIYEKYPDGDIPKDKVFNQLKDTVDNITELTDNEASN